MTSSENKGWGVVWILLGPVIFLMVSASTVEPRLAYVLQLGGCGAVSIAGVRFGWGAMMGEARSVTGLVVLSCVVAIYFIGSGLLLLAWPSKAGLLMRVGLAFLVGGWGVPFLYMAHAIGSSARESEGPQPNP
jgi:hypothetical protein